MAQDSTTVNIPDAQPAPAGYAPVAMPGAQMPLQGQSAFHNPNDSASQMIPVNPQPLPQALPGQVAPAPQPTGFYAVPGQQQQDLPPQQQPMPGAAQPFPQPMGVAPAPLGGQPPIGEAPLGGGPPMPAQPYGQPMPGHPPPLGAVAPAPAPQTFAIPGQNQENAEAPPPFQPPQALPVVPQYQWQPGVYHTVGAPVPVQQIYYPAPPEAKGEEQHPDQVPQGVQFQQAKINFGDEVGIRVANKGCHCLDCWALEFVFFLLVVFTIPLVIVSPGLIAIPIVIYLIRFAVICCTDTSKFLRQLNLDINPYDLTATLQKTEPYTLWHIRCYHWETRYRTVTESDGQGGTRTRTESYQVQVTTHTNSKCITYPDCVDASPILSGLEKYRMTRIYNTLRIAFGTEECNKYYQKKRYKWIRKNDRDVHYDFSQNDYLPGMISHLLTFNDDKSKYPACLTCCCLCGLGFLMMDWILIFWFMRHSARLDYQYFKIASHIGKKRKPYT